MIENNLSKNKILKFNAKLIYDSNLSFMKGLVDTFL